MGNRFKVVRTLAYMQDLQTCEVEGQLLNDPQ